MSENNQNYTLRKHKFGNQTNFDIEQENLLYSDCTSHHGMQCNHVGGTPEHDEIMKLCDELIMIVKKIDKLNTI